MAANGKSATKFRVIIVGGSVAGLTLALCLERAGIDYVVLEARREISPQVGASIGIFSNGARILDQLGVYDTIEKHVDPPIWNCMLTGEGRLVQKLDSLLLMHKRTGYPVAFLERRQVLQILYEHCADQSKILTGKRVVGVDHLDHGVKVRCEDGSEFAGDMVAGADGVHSQIREAMWDHGETNNGLKYVKKDKKVAMFAEYRCLFGFSSAIPCLDEKTLYRTFNRDWSFLVVVGKDRQCFWFVFEKLDKVYRCPNLPRYNQDTDQADFTKPFMKRYVAPTVTFDALWRRRKAATLTVLEEAQYAHWTCGRIVCLGDAIHKMTPNIGQGGNWAIEDTAELTNKVNAMLKRTQGQPSAKDISTTLQDFERSRHPRTKEVCDTAGMATRLEAFANMALEFMALYVVPNAGDILVDVHCQSVVEAPMLDFVPPPARSLVDGTVFQTARFREAGDTPAWRALRALPLLILGVVAHRTLGGGIASTAVVGDEAGSLQSMAALIADLTALQIVGMVETERRGNQFSFGILWPVFALLGYWKGWLAYTVPAYLFLHYVQCSPDRLAAPDNRFVPRHHAKTIAIAVAVGHVLPAVGFLYFHTLSDGTAAHFFERMWKASPLITFLVQRGLASVMPDTTATDRVDNPRSDMNLLRLTYAAGGLASGVTYGWLTATSQSPTSIFREDASQLWQALRRVMGSEEVISRQLIRYHHFITIGSALLWALLHLGDLSRTGRMNINRIVVAVVVLGTAAVMGPGAAVVVAWAWREQVLAQKLGLGADREKKRR
ncbi:hypothetical protein F4808DRAFT_459082 [Astrocystis sublimbata]|nr:hypothetical protein F4808DRAFT_459082 [Astrocystis sublimbata]